MHLCNMIHVYGTLSVFINCHGGGCLQPYISIAYVGPGDQSGFSDTGLNATKSA